jgi:hypothetical protein
MVERRWERRLLCADLVQVEWKDHEGGIRSTTAILEDISRSGACLQTDVPVPVNGLVQMIHGRKTLEGTISYCAYRDIGYFAGITFTAKQQWSRRMFRPKHLVDPAELEKGPDDAPTLPSAAAKH